MFPSLGFLLFCVSVLIGLGAYFRLSKCLIYHWCHRVSEANRTEDNVAVYVMMCIKLC